MVHSNSKYSRRRWRRWNANSRLFIRKDVVASSVRTVQVIAAEICEAPSHKNVDSALDNRKNTKRRRRRSRKIKDNQYEKKHMSYSPHQDIGSNHSSSSTVPKRMNDSEITDYISLPSASKLMSLAEKEHKLLSNTVFDNSHKHYIPSEVKEDAVNCSDSREFVKCRQRIKCLNNEVQENHSSHTACLRVIGQDKYDCGDLALMNIGPLYEEIDVLSTFPAKTLRITFRKKLLVLDLNGILCDVVCGSHGSHIPHKKVSRKSVFMRPFLDDFMTFCFERFDVGIWSSRNKKNVAGVIDYLMGDSKDKLLFCWDQSKCTLTGFNTIKDRYKPLVLKELIKLWDKEEATLPWKKGDYSPLNTLLVDDSPYKALCNPPNTAIFPFPYDFRDEGDNSLGPGGALQVYLECIAMVDDVQQHVKEYPFGQLAITSEDEEWSFYKNIIDKNNSMSLT